VARDDNGMTLGDVSLTCAWALVDELVRGGMSHACLSPGSRSTPLALALARHPAIMVHVQLDERSSAFFALGIAKATGQPVAVACTSGTAAAELFPAVVEASQGRVPLILLTADRPPRLRGTGANQTIDQVELYGTYARTYLEPPVPNLEADVVGTWRAAGRAAIGAARHGDRARLTEPGPAHVNCCFEEPLAPSASTVLEPPGEQPFWGETLPALGPPELRDLVRGAERGLVVAGPLRRHEPQVHALAARLGWPLLAEPLSHARRPGALAAGQALAASPTWRDAMAPDVVLQFGAAPTTRATQALVAAGRTLAVVDDGFPDPDPDHRAAITVHAPAGGVAAGLLDPDGADPTTAWLAAWRAADPAARAAVDALLDAWPEPSEPRVARDLAAVIPDGGTLFVGNSMPVRDLDAYMAPRDGLRVLANRGASGIDGLVSTALGVAASGTGPTFALLGDLSFFYDAGAVLWNGSRGIDLVIVVNDNDGGQIFAGLGQGELPHEELERLFVTPHGADLDRLCGAAGAGHTLVERAADLPSAIEATTASGGVHVLRVAIDAERDRQRRGELRAAIERAVEALA
jgi:2-succinyl-5-enolpyruvyl-6-hydroxy-3-cyclohexene-1-carboxylate synthase